MASALTAQLHNSYPLLLVVPDHNHNHNDDHNYNHSLPLLVADHNHNHNHNDNHPLSLLLADHNYNHNHDHPLHLLLDDHSYDQNQDHPVPIAVPDHNYNHDHSHSHPLPLVLDDHDHYHNHNHDHNQPLPPVLAGHNHDHNHNHPLPLVPADHSNNHNHERDHDHNHNHPLPLVLADQNYNYNHNHDRDNSSTLACPDGDGEGVLDWHELCFEMPSSSHEYEDDVVVAAAEQDLGGFQFDHDFFLVHDIILSHGEDNTPPFINTSTTTTTTMQQQQQQQKQEEKTVGDGTTSSSTWGGTTKGEGCTKNFGEEERLKKRNGEGLLLTGRARSKRSRFGGFNGMWGSTMLSLHENTILLEEEDDDNEEEDEESILTDVSSTSNTFCQAEILSISHANVKKEDLPPLKQPNEKTLNMKKEKEKEKKMKKKGGDYSNELVEVLDQPFYDPYQCRRCLHCLSEKTPQWRQGPLGPKTLCNACGVRYKSGRLFPEYRPAKSPTFLIHRHSNSHKKVLEMRLHKASKV